jgi:hypothetical protein
MILSVVRLVTELSPLIAEDSLVDLVLVKDTEVTVLDADAVTDGGDDRLRLRLLFLRLPMGGLKRLFRPLSVRDVEEHPVDVSEFALRVVDKLAPVRNPSVLPILVENPVFHPEVLLLRFHGLPKDSLQCIEIGGMDSFFPPDDPLQ